MERKIGEIFEYNGEWYQCIKNDSCCCDYCDFSELGDCDNIACASGERNDNKEVHFKKLEKVGEPITINGKNVQLLKTTIANCENCAFYKDVNCDFTCYPRECYGGEEGTYIEIKQNKEDMEEKKVKVSRENWDYLVDKFQYILADHLHGGESDEVIAEFENLLEIDNPEEKKLDFLPFNLEAAKAGKPVCIRDGRKARIICFDLQSIKKTPIVAAIQVTDKQEIIANYYEDGRQFIDGISDLDLMMLPEKKEGWINIIKTEDGGYCCKGEVHSDYNDAFIENINALDNRGITVKIEWEE